MVKNTFYVIPKDSDITHYGVQGMKWGVRKKSVYEPTGRPVGRPRTNPSYSQYSSKANLKKKKLSAGKKVAIGVAAAAAVAAGGYAVYKVYGSDIKRAASLGKMALTSKVQDKIQNMDPEKVQKIDKALVKARQGVHLAKQGKHVVGKVLAVKGAIDIGVNSVQVARGKKTLNQVLRPSTSSGKNKGLVRTAAGLATGRSSILDVASKSETLNNKITKKIDNMQSKIDKARERRNNRRTRDGK